MFNKLAEDLKRIYQLMNGFCKDKWCRLSKIAD